MSRMFTFQPYEVVGGRWRIVDLDLNGGACARCRTTAVHAATAIAAIRAGVGACWRGGRRGVSAAAHSLAITPSCQDMFKVEHALGRKIVDPLVRIGPTFVLKPP